MSGHVVLADGGEGGGGYDWTHLLTPGVIIAGLVVVLILFVVVTVLVLLGVRRLRRSPTFTTGALALRAAAGEGTNRDIAQMRLQLRQSLTSTDRSLAAAQASDEPVGELPAIVANLHHAGALLDRQLRLAQSDPDPTTQSTIATDLAPQLEQLKRTASGVRRAAAEASAAISSASLEPAIADLTTEADVLKTWSQTYKGLGQP